ncbi:GNAT family N-acetyltransferase [Emticicia sp. BO119]|uniref:GNAT family N-acetyltransferase n=1 Tax=Emticicia sp. BO119 TaxID=2757768 RepID=UPI0015F0B390|nr:GNAT family protein [Emticicia sp. BO119]MBA4853091.1 GNAT family N-acetyltransferase [Emticicia sp. BO119]
MELVPIREYLDENDEWMKYPECQELVEMTVEFYERVGFTPPWICYFVKDNENIIGSAGIKGKPLNNTIEIAYGTMEEYRHQGVGTSICKSLVELSLKSDPSIKITARTLPQNKFSCRVLEKNNFTCVGIVDDPEDGEVLEWVYNYTG